MRKLYKTAFQWLFLAAVFSLTFQYAAADMVDDLKSKIDERNKIIQDLEKEISQYQTQVEKTSAQGTSLKSKIAALELTRKKLSAEVKVIENKIARATLSIQELNIQISDTALTIKRELSAIAGTLEQTNEEESNSLVETLLNYRSISSFLDRVESLSELNQGLKTEIKNGRFLKQDL